MTTGRDHRALREARHRGKPGDYLEKGRIALWDV